jgi:hypothetical protein
LLRNVDQAIAAYVAVGSSGQTRKLEARAHRRGDPLGSGTLAVEMRSHVCAYTDRFWLDVVISGFGSPHELRDEKPVSNAVGRPVPRSDLD